MIRRNDLQIRAREWGLEERVVEKDYVIGWVLWGIGTDPELQKTWAFKGGTCLKKCYLETYRFSEDLDFTVLPQGPLDPDQVQPILQRVLTRVEEESGLDLNSRAPHLKERRQATEARLYYRGPTGAREHAKIKLDLTGSETVVRPTVLRPIAHSYPDALPGRGVVRCYGFEEVFAEKIRALGERCRPRDLYDVVYLFRRRDLAQVPHLIREVLADKCESKGGPIPTLALLEGSPHRGDIETEWANMLGHQLPALPEFHPLWDELPHLFAWLSGEWEPPELQEVGAGTDLDYEWKPPDTLYLWGSGVPFEPIRFAGANRLCIELGYGGRRRLLEPYSLRRTRDGHLLLFGIKVGSGELRSYRVDRIESVRVTHRIFRPRYRVEFGQSGSIGIPSTARSPRSRTRSSTPTSQARYTLECSTCGRRFPRKIRNTSIRPHKDARGGPCGGRRGRFV